MPLSSEMFFCMIRYLTSRMGRHILHTFLFFAYNIYDFWSLYNSEDSDQFVQTRMITSVLI